MEEKEKRISKEEDSGYGPTADNDSCRLADGDSSEPTDSNSCEPTDSDSCGPTDSDSCGLATDDRTPFSENAETRRLQNAFGEALGDLPLPDEVREEWSTFLQRQAQQKRKLYLHICLSGGVAAAIALLLLLWSPWHITDKDSILQNIEIFTALHAPEQITTIEENGRIIVSTPPATTTRLTLEDGSHVLLSANSRLEYPKEFSSQGSRTVNLTGEARFEVTKDAHRPFIVSADKMQTQVLGTVFDVNAYPGNAPAVTLYQGRVKVGKAASPIEKEIVPGQCATLTTSGDIRLAKATRTEKEGWTKDEFYYDNTEMITVLQNIGTWYNISVICHSADLLHKRVHFRFSRNVPIKTLLNVLNDLGIAHFQYKDKQIVVE